MLTRAYSILQHPGDKKTKSSEHRVRLQLDRQEKTKINKKQKNVRKLKSQFLATHLWVCRKRRRQKLLKWNSICNILSEFPQCLKLKNILSVRRHLCLNNAIHRLSWSVKKSQPEKAQSAFVLDTSKLPVSSQKWCRTQQVCVCLTKTMLWVDLNCITLMFSGWGWWRISHKISLACQIFAWWWLQ